MQQEMVKLVDVNKSYRDRQVLQHINFTVKKGETVAVIGASGSGKSTLLKLLIGLERPTSGEVWLKEQEISKISEDELNKIRLNVGMVFQYSALFDSMSVGENVAFGLREHSDLSKGQIEEIVEEKLAMVGLENFASYLPNELSGGMRKRVSLARALAFNPDLVFYDEPSSGLDPIMAGKIDNIIRYTQEKLNMTSVVVTHDMNSAYYIADRIMMIYQGQIIAAGDVKSIRSSSDERVQEFLSGGRGKCPKE